MSKLVIALSATLIGILLFGYNYQNTPKYAAEEISKINKDIISSVYSLQEARRVKYTNASIDESEDKTAPIIEIIYPREFKHGAIIETDKVELKFSDNVKVVKARMNNLTISTDTVKITTTGTYNIEIEDEAKNKTRLAFTITQKAIESEEAQKAEAQKKAQEEAKRKARVAAEKKAQEAKARKAQEEEKRAQAQAERIAREEAARKAEAEKLAQEEAEKKVQKAAQLAQTKSNLKSQLDNYKKISDYSPEQQAQLSAAIAAGKNAIDSAGDVNTANNALATAKATMDGIKTNPQTEAEIESVQE